jgi:hypothetical protein
MEKRLGFKRNYIKMQGQSSGVTGLAQGEMSCGDGPKREGETRCGKKREGETRRGKKSRLVMENWAKELTE